MHPHPDAHPLPSPPPSLDMYVNPSAHMSCPSHQPLPLYTPPPHSPVLPLPPSSPPVHQNTSCSTLTWVVLLDLGTAVIGEVHEGTHGTL